MSAVWLACLGFETDGVVCAFVIGTAVSVLFLLELIKIVLVLGSRPMYVLQALGEADYITGGELRFHL